MDQKKIILLLSRGETVRNFIYSGVVESIQQHLEVIIYSVVKEDFIPKNIRENISQYHNLKHYNEKRIVLVLRKLFIGLISGNNGLIRLKIIGQCMILEQSHILINLREPF